MMLFNHQVYEEPPDVEIPRVLYETNIELLNIFRSLFMDGDVIATKRRLKQLNDVMQAIFSSPSTGDAFAYLLLNGACTAFSLQEDLGMPEATTFRVLKRLRKIGLIEICMRIAKMREIAGGPRTKVWMLVGTDINIVAKAVSRHIKLKKAFLRNLK